METDIRHRLARYPRPQAELDAWTLDQRINDRGVRLDPVLVEKALELDAAYTGRLLAEAKAAPVAPENPAGGEGSADEGAQTDQANADGQAGQGAADVPDNPDSAADQAGDGGDE